MASSASPTTTARSTTTGKGATTSIVQRRQAAELSACSATLHAAFADDPMLRYVLTRNMADPGRASSLINNAALTALLFDIIVGGSRAAHGLISSASPGSAGSDDYSTVGIFMPPGHDPDHPLAFVGQLGRVCRLVYGCGPTITWRLIVTFPARVAAMKRRGFTADQVKRLDFYYIYFFGTRPEAQGRGLGSAWLRRCQEEAAQAGKPIWLESSSVRSRNLYARLGWRVVVEETFGKGLYDAEGRPVVPGTGDAPGVRLWGMIWWPDGLDPLKKPDAQGN